ncbi:MAG: cytochrome C [Sulfurospirillaceae bacterium]|jgi:trimethylamine-N-oxide reductase cytochrome c-type subunit TorC|nr:cytochrome C [Sulfurospirillaceae bacterium]MCK9546072.1 cytochrome C [Sulfurospirillaceae bacterium]MDY0237265.1 cytochrome C [Campylobacterales bacterium]NLN00143.1 cytochrome C [Campylobacteraceae bacterium]
MIRNLLLTAIVATAIVAGEVAYSTKEKNVYLEANSDRVVGKLLPTNAIEILEEVGDRVKFKIEGFQNPKTGSIIYYTTKARIFSLAFARTAEPELEVLDDSLEDGWRRVSTIAYTTKGDFESKLEPMMQRAGKLYSDNCSMCHTLHEVNHYTANQWPPTFKGMIERTPLDKDDIWLVTQYLQKNAKDMK